jgi:hypothetical protein
MTDKSIYSQPKPPSTAQTPATPSPPSNTASHGLSAAMQSFPSHATPAEEPSILEGLIQGAESKWRLLKLAWECQQPNLDDLLDKVFLDYVMGERPGALADAALLLSNGARIQNDRLLLSIACKHRDLELLKLLLRNGVSPNGKEAVIDGHTLLGHMCLTGDVDFVKLLLDSPVAWVNDKCCGRTPLYSSSHCKAGDVPQDCDHQVVDGTGSGYR